MWDGVGFNSGAGLQCESHVQSANGGGMPRRSKRLRPMRRGEDDDEEEEVG